MVMKIALIIFTKNEEKNLKKMFNKIPLRIVDKVYAVDGGSSDGTPELFIHNKIPVITQKYPGVGGAYEAAFSNTTEDALIFFHPDGNMDPKDIKRFVKKLNAGYGFIVATRMVKGGRNEEDGGVIKPRKWFCQLLGLLSNMLWGKPGNKTTDITQGYRAITRNAYKKLAIKRPDAIAPDFEQVISALKKDIAIYEFPTYEGRRKFGQTSMKPLATGLANIRVFLRAF